MAACPVFRPIRPHRFGPGEGGMLDMVDMAYMADKVDMLAWWA